MYPTDRNIHTFKPDTVVHACIVPITQEAEAGGSFELRSSRSAGQHLKTSRVHLKNNSK